MNKEELRQQAAISVLNSLLETTKHSVIESLAIRDIYATAAVLYADALVSALDKNEHELSNLVHDNKRNLLERLIRANRKNSLMKCIEKLKNK